MGPIQNLQDLFSWLRRRWQMMVVTLLMGAVGGVIWALTSERVFSANAVIQVINPVVAVTEEGTGTAPDVTRRVQIIEQRLMSREALVSLADRYDLFDGLPLSAAEQVELMRENISISAIAAAQQGFSRDGSLAALVVNVNDAQAARAAAIANDLAEALVAQSVSDRQSNAQQALEFFAEEESRLEATIGALEDAISTYRTQNEQYLPAAVTVRRTERARLSEQLLDIQQEITSRESTLGGLDSGSRRAVTRRQIDTLQEEIAQYQDQAIAIEARIAEIQQVLVTAPAVEQEIEAASRRMEQFQAQLTAAAERRREAELSARIEDDQQSERFEILERALVPDYPVSTSRTTMALMGIIGGLGLGVMLAYLLEWMNPVMRTASRMERELQLRPVISIPYTVSDSEIRRKQMIWIIGGGAMLVVFLILALLAAIT